MWLRLKVNCEFNSILTWWPNEASFQLLLTVLSHELVELVEGLSGLGPWLVRVVLLWTTRVRWRALTPVTAHERGQDGWIVHSPVQSSQQCPHSRGHNSRVAAPTVCVSSPYRKWLHLQLLPGLQAPFALCVLGAVHFGRVLATVAEATVLVLMSLEKAVNRSQPQSVVWSRASNTATGTVAVTSTVTGPSTAVRIDFFTPFTETGKEKTKLCRARNMF